MKFLVAWSSAPETRHEAYEAFAQMSDADDAADHPGVNLIGRWHDLASGGGILICESDDLSAVEAWTWNWNGVLDIEVTPVLDDDECKTVIKKKLGQ